MGDEQSKVPEKRSYSPTAVLSFSSCADIFECQPRYQGRSAGLDPESALGKHRD
jgi:hypothetical protein